MRAWVHKSWPYLKALLAVAILVAIGRQFARDLHISERGLGPGLQELWERCQHPQWLLASGVLYLLGLGCAATYWYRLLRDLDQHPSWFSAFRAHYVGQMGKYLPGKAWALFLRSSLVRGPRARVGIAVMTSFYEVLATMATGALFAAVFFALQVPDWSAPLDWHELGRLLPRARAQANEIDPRIFVLLALMLLAPVGLPIIPPVFNWLSHRIAMPFRDADAAPLPRVRAISLLEAVVLTTGCWLMMGASLWAILHAIMADAPALSLTRWAQYTAFAALSYVAGFIILVVPSGLGVREFFLLLFLVPEISPGLGENQTDARATAALAVLLLRLVWTAAELVVVGAVYWLPGPGVSRELKLGAVEQPQDVGQEVRTTGQ
jgi:uncharacterized membrane protein YbhN (UPF0104 family)